MSPAALAARPGTSALAAPTLGGITEITEKPAVLRAYVGRWRFEAGAFFTEIGPEDSLERWAGVAARCPVFRLAFEG